MTDYKLRGECYPQWGLKAAAERRFTQSDSGLFPLSLICSASWWTLWIRTAEHWTYWSCSSYIRLTIRYAVKHSTECKAIKINAQVKVQIEGDRTRASHTDGNTSMNIWHVLMNPTHWTLNRSTQQIFSEFNFTTKAQMHFGFWALHSTQLVNYKLIIFRPPTWDRESSENRVIMCNITSSINACQCDHLLMFPSGEAAAIK